MQVVSTVRRPAAPKMALKLLLVAAVAGVAGCSGQDRELAGKVDSLTKQLEETRAELQRLQDVKQIEKLTRTYGYYIDKGLWSQVVDLFAEDGSV